MRVLGIIPARGGSVRIPRKNLARVHGISLLHGAMIAASRSLRLTDWRVSTDDAEIAINAAYFEQGTAPAKCPGCGKPWQDRVTGDAHRVLSRKHSAGDGPMVRVLQEAVTDLRNSEPFDAVCTIQPTSPLRTWEDIDGTIELLMKHPDAMSAVSVSKQTGKRNGAVYVTRLPMLADGKVWDDDSLVYPMEHSRCLDINTPEDLAEARKAK